MPARFEIRTGDDCHNEGMVAADGAHEWVALVAGNGETLMTTETYPVGHGLAHRAIEDIITCAEVASKLWVDDVAKALGI